MCRLIAAAPLFLTNLATTTNPLSSITERFVARHISTSAWSYPKASLGCIDIFFQEHARATVTWKQSRRLQSRVFESAELLESVEAAFDAVAQLVESAVVQALHLATAARRDYGDRSRAFNSGYDGVRVVALIGEHGFGPAAVQQWQGFGILRRLAGSPTESDRLAEAIGEQVDFGAQSTSATPQGLVFRAPFCGP
jgi:hypothetical protein